MPDIIHIKHPVSRDTVDHDHIYGPDRDGRYLTIKSTLYDAKTDVLELRLKAVLGPDLMKRVTPLVHGQNERDRIRKVFNG